METKDRDYFMAFVHVSKAISSTLDLQEVLDIILKEGIDSLSLHAGAISLLNKREDRLELIAQENLSERFLKKGPVLADKSIPRAIRTGGAVVVPDIDHDDQLQYPEECRKEGIRSILSVPIIFKEEIIGVLRLYDSKPRDFTFREVQFITALAEQGGIAIENARFMQELESSHKQEMSELWDWFQSMTGKSMLDG